MSPKPREQPEWSPSTYLSHGCHDGVVEPLDRGGQPPEGHGQLVEGLLGVVRDDDVVAALVVGRDPHEGGDRRRSHGGEGIVQFVTVAVVVGEDDVGRFADAQSGLQLVPLALKQYFIT